MDHADELEGSPIHARILTTIAQAFHWSVSNQTDYTFVSVLSKSLNHLLKTLKASFRPSLDDFSQFLILWCQFLDQTQPSEEESLWVDHMVPLTSKILIYYDTLVKEHVNHKKLFTTFLDTLFVPLFKTRRILLRYVSKYTTILDELDQCISDSLFHESHYSEFIQSFIPIVQAQWTEDSGSKRRKIDDTPTGYLIPVQDMTGSAQRYPVKLLQKLQVLCQSDIDIASESVPLLLQKYIDMVRNHTLQANDQTKSSINEQHQIICFYILLHSLVKNNESHHSLLANERMLSILCESSVYRKNDDTENMNHFYTLSQYTEILINILRNNTKQTYETLEIILSSMTSLLNIDYTLVEEHIPFLLEFIFFKYENEKRTGFKHLNECLSTIIDIYSKLRKLNDLLNTLFSMMKRHTFKVISFPSFWKAYTQCIEQIPVGQIDKIYQLLLDELEVFVMKIIQQETGLMALTGIEDDTPTEMYKENFIMLSLLFSNYTASLKLNPIVSSQLVEHRIQPTYRLLSTLLEGRLQEAASSKSRAPFPSDLQAGLLLYVGIQALESQIYNYFVVSETYFERKPYFHQIDDPTLSLTTLIGLHKQKKLNLSLRAILHRICFQRLSQIHSARVYESTVANDFFFRAFYNVSNVDEERDLIMSFFESELEKVPYFLYKKEPLLKASIALDRYSIILYDEVHIYYMLWEWICNHIFLLASHGKSFISNFVKLWIQSLKDPHFKIIYERSHILLVDAQFYDIAEVKQIILSQILEGLFNDWKSQQENNSQSRYFLKALDVCIRGNATLNDIKSLLKKAKKEGGSMMDIQESDCSIQCLYRELIEGIPEGYLSMIELQTLISTLFVMLVDTNLKNLNEDSSQLLRSISRLIDIHPTPYTWFLPEFVTWIIDNIELDPNVELLFSTYIRRLLESSSSEIVTSIYEHIKKHSGNLDVVSWLYRFVITVNQHHQVLVEKEKYKKKKAKKTSVWDTEMSKTLSDIIIDAENMLDLDVWNMETYVDLERDTTFLLKFEILHYYWNLKLHIDEAKVQSLSQWFLNDTYSLEYPLFFRSFISGLNKDQSHSLLEHIQISIDKHFQSSHLDLLLNDLKRLKETLECLDPSIRYQVIGAYSGQFISTLSHIQISWDLTNVAFREDIELLILQLLTLFIQDKFAFLSSRHIATILGCLVPQDKQQLSTAMFLAHYHLLISLIRIRPYQTIHNIAPFYLSMKYLLMRCIIQRDLPMICTHHVSRLYTELASTKSVPKLFGTYILVEFVEVLEKETVHMEIRDAMYPGIFTFMSQFDDAQIKSISKHLNEIGKNMFRQMYEVYVRDFKFDGKV